MCRIKTHKRIKTKKSITVIKRSMYITNR